MSQFEPRNSDFTGRIERSFARQPFAEHIGARLAHIAPGEIDIVLPFKREISQQYGYVHGGVTTAVADAAAGYAALTLADSSVGVLTTDLKVNFLRPAGQGLLTAQGRVIKTGRTLTIVQTDVYEDLEGEAKHVQTGLITIMYVPGLQD